MHRDTCVIALCHAKTKGIHNVSMWRVMPIPACIPTLNWVKSRQKWAAVGSMNENEWPVNEGGAGRGSAVAGGR
jgi:hypothetical protein